MSIVLPLTWYLRKLPGLRQIDSEARAGRYFGIARACWPGGGGCFPGFKFSGPDLDDFRSVANLNLKSESGLELSGPRSSLRIQLRRDSK